MMYRNCKYCGKRISYNKNVCNECIDKNNKDKKDNTRVYNRIQRDKEHNKFYHSTSWKYKRKYIIERDNGLCQLCLDNKNIKVYTCVHHIEPINTSWDDRLECNNLICVCDSCHKHIHKVYEGIDIKEIKNIKEKMKEIIKKNK